jgi:hypothetical protein
MRARAVTAVIILSYTSEQAVSVSAMVRINRGPLDTEEFRTLSNTSKMFMNMYIACNKVYIENWVLFSLLTHLPLPPLLKRQGKGSATGVGSVQKGSPPCEITGDGGSESNTTAVSSGLGGVVHPP